MASLQPVNHEALSVVLRKYEIDPDTVLLSGWNENGYWEFQNEPGAPNWREWREWPESGKEEILDTVRSATRWF